MQQWTIGETVFGQPFAICLEYDDQTRVLASVDGQVSGGGGSFEIHRAPDGLYECVSRIDGDVHRAADPNTLLPWFVRYGRCH